MICSLEEEGLSYSRQEVLLCRKATEDAGSLLALCLQASRLSQISSLQEDRVEVHSFYIFIVYCVSVPEQWTKSTKLPALEAAC